MLRKIGKYVGYTLLWIVIVAALLWAHNRAATHRAEQVVGAMNISIENGDDKQLIDSHIIEEWIAKHNLSPIGITIDKVAVEQIEEQVRRHTAVANADVYTTYDGDVNISIEQRRPVARLRMDGYDAYITAEGYIVPAAEGYSAHVPVVTGGYRPLFGSNYAGYAEDVTRDSIAALERVIALLEEQKIPLYEQQQQNNKELRLILSERLSKGFFQSDEEYEILKNHYNQRRSDARNKHRYRNQQLRAGIAILEQQQHEARKRQQQLEQQDADFDALLDFLKFVGEDSYWSAEVVQVIASGGGGKQIELSIVPRSGRFLVDLGATTELRDKLATLERFYRKGLDNVGWDKYRHISLRYRGQVVCK